MPQARLYGIELLPQDALSHSCPTLIDAQALEALIGVLIATNDYAERVKFHKTWQFAVLLDHAKELPEWKSKLAAQAKALGITVVKSTQVERKLVAEIHLAYFGGIPAGQEAAELLAYGRRHTTQALPVRVISPYAPFQYVPNVDVVMLSNLALISSPDDAAFHHTFEALALHPKVKQIAEEYWPIHKYHAAMLDAINTYYADLKDLCQHDHDGLNLLQKAFDIENNKTPTVQLTPLQVDSDKNEQRGYYHLNWGVQAAVRNLVAHHGPDSAFIQQRFGDRRTALKFLCLLSLLFEKLDKRVAPPPR